MTFLAQSASKTLLKLQQNHLRFELTIMNSRFNAKNREISNMEFLDSSSDDTSSNLENDPYYRQLQKEAERFQMQRDDITDQIEVLEKEISDMKNMVTNGIKSSCGFTISGG